MNLWAPETAAQRHWNGVAVARPGMLALVVALTGSARSVVTDWWWLGALALVALAASISDRIMPRTKVLIFAEMALAAMTIGLGLPDAYLALPYLLVPAFAAGLAGSIAGASIATFTGSIAMICGNVLAGGNLIELPTFASISVWIVILFATGAIGAWVLRMDSIHIADGGRYAAAYRLLSELRLVSRRLSVGLDPGTLAEGILDQLAGPLSVKRAALLVRREGDALLPLAHRGKDDGWLAGAENDPTITEAWNSEAPTWTANGHDDYRVALPLRVGSRMTGVVVAEVPDQLTTQELQPLLESTDEGSLRLETALLFDEVRELATHEERRRLAREIHDGIAQELTSVGYLVDDLTARTTDADTHSLSLTLRQELTRILTNLRHSIFDLRSDLERGGIGTSLSAYARQVGTQAGLKVHFSNSEEHERLRPEVEAELLRIGQEAITNVRKHAKAKNLWVTVSVSPPNAHIRVVDDGSGMRDKPRGRYGLEIMAERARRVGAKLVVDDGPNTGTVVDVSLGAFDERGVASVDDSPAR